MSYSEYKYDIFEAILRIREIENNIVIISIPIPNKLFEFLRYKEYPYNTPYLNEKLFTSSNINTRRFLINKLFKERINPYFQQYGALIK